MSRINNIKLKSLEKTKNYYIWELKRCDSLTESERNKYQIALKAINRVIREKENPGKERKHNKKSVINTKYFSKRGF